MHLPNAIMGFHSVNVLKHKKRILLHSIRLLYNLQDIGFVGGAGVVSGSLLLFVAISRRIHTFDFLEILLQTFFCSHIYSY